MPNEVWSRQQASLVNSFLTSIKGLSIGQKNVSDDEESLKNTVICDTS
ncbi:MAG: hypothetical protein U9N07_02280 [Euryarchaeota archaeon]|nr:hypothetical protein [Euryarchaeota archaeon]